MDTTATSYARAVAYGRTVLAEVDAEFGAHPDRMPWPPTDELAAELGLARAIHVHEAAARESAVEGSAAYHRDAAQRLYHAWTTVTGSPDLRTMSASDRERAERQGRYLIARATLHRCLARFVEDPPTADQAAAAAG